MACGDFFGCFCLFVWGGGGFLWVFFSGFYFQNMYFTSEVLQSFRAIMDRSVWGNAETSFK